mmetsp:Transcript_4571/g.11925  ORF Transcript_4571/g.11925 Transcript_4571/m.11925 type:complete len:213 (+) Transcript_4571:706-1344(+)
MLFSHSRNARNAIWEGPAPYFTNVENKKIRLTKAPILKRTAKPSPKFPVAPPLVFVPGNVALQFNNSLLGGDGLNYFFLGLNTLITSSFPSILGPPMRSMQYGIAGKTAFKHVRTAAGFPGKVTTRLLPQIPAVCLDKMAVGTPSASEALLISSPKPGRSFAHTRSIASGVTSRNAGPVPPVVTIRAQPFFSENSLIVDSMSSCSSGMHLSS